MKSFLALIFCLVPLASAPAFADKNPVLIELFASQNCQACPKAHKTLQSVATENDDVLVLTWSVDYWDYLGEADPMAMPEAKARQAGYTDQMKLRAPYTPQSVYDGVKHCPATKRGTIDNNIDDRRQSATSTAQRFQRQGSKVHVLGDCDTPTDVLLVEYLPADKHDTGMVNPVTASRTIGQCTLDQTEFEISCVQACAVILQERGYGEVRSAMVWQ